MFSNQVNAEEHKSVKPFIEAYRKWQDDNTIGEPAYPGDVAAVPIEVNLPRKRDGHDELKAEAILAVRLADADEAKGDLADTVSYFRGARMVVQYRNFRKLAVSAQSYHAVLICGTAKANYNSDVALERFLRAAEPPEHNTWASTENLKKAYKQGYGKALNEMDHEVRRRLRGLVTEKAKSGAQGPDLFRKKFPIGNTGGGNAARSFVDLRGLVAYVDGNGTMHFEGQLRAHSHSPKVWEAKLDFRIAEEDKRGEHAPVRNFTTTQNGRVSVHHQNGEGELALAVSEGTRTVDFRGEIDLRHAVAEPDLSSIDVAVVGQEVNR